MSGIGFWELIILSLIGLIVLGPERLPRVANQLGSWLGQARRMTRVMKRQLEEELNFEDDFKIKPPNRAPSSQPVYKPPSDDDTQSAAHRPGEVGTGVGDIKADDQDPAATGAAEADGSKPAAKKSKAGKKAKSKKTTAQEPS